MTTMQQFTSSFNVIVSLLTIVAQVLSVALIVALFSKKFEATKFVGFFKKRATLVALVVSTVATAGSLTYSDIIGYAPCTFCWFQRIFMYPQVLIMGIALIIKDSSAKMYGAALSVIGAAIALFHYLGQLGVTELPCSAVGVSVSCTHRAVFQFGYITIPLMAFSAFLLIALSLVISMRKANSVKA